MSAFQPVGPYAMNTMSVNASDIQASGSGLHIFPQQSPSNRLTQLPGTSGHIVYQQVGQDTPHLVAGIQGQTTRGVFVIRARSESESVAATNPPQPLGLPPVTEIFSNTAHSSARTHATSLSIAQSPNTHTNVTGPLELDASFNSSLEEAPTIPMSSTPFISAPSSGLVGPSSSLRLQLGVMQNQGTPAHQSQGQTLYNTTQFAFTGAPTEVLLGTQPGPSQVQIQVKPPSAAAALAVTAKSYILQEPSLPVHRGTISLAKSGTGFVIVPNSELLGINNTPALQLSHPHPHPTPATRPIYVQVTQGQAATLLQKASSSQMTLVSLEPPHANTALPVCTQGQAQTSELMISPVVGPMEPVYTQLSPLSTSGSERFQLSPAHSSMVSVESTPALDMTPTLEVEGQDAESETDSADEGEGKGEDEEDEGEQCEEEVEEGEDSSKAADSKEAAEHESTSSPPKKRQRRAGGKSSEKQKLPSKPKTEGEVIKLKHFLTQLLKNPNVARFASKERDGIIGSGGGRVRMRDWLEQLADSALFEELKWLEDEKSRERGYRLLEMPWRHHSSSEWDESDHRIFILWALYTGKFSLKDIAGTTVGNSPADDKRWKSNFRCALNSLPDVHVDEEHTKKSKSGVGATRVYRLTLPTTAVGANARLTHTLANPALALAASTSRSPPGNARRPERGPTKLVPGAIGPGAVSKRHHPSATAACSSAAKARYDYNEEDEDESYTARASLGQVVGKGTKRRHATSTFYGSRSFATHVAQMSAQSTNKPALTAGSYLKTSGRLPVVQPSPVILARAVSQTHSTATSTTDFKGLIISTSDALTPRTVKNEPKLPTDCVGGGRILTLGQAAPLAAGTASQANALKLEKTESKFEAPPMALKVTVARPLQAQTMQQHLNDQAQLRDPTLLNQVQPTPGPLASLSSPQASCAGTELFRHEAGVEAYGLGMQYTEGIHSLNDLNSDMDQFTSSLKPAYPAHLPHSFALQGGSNAILSSPPPPSALVSARYSYQNFDLSPKPFVESLQNTSATSYLLHQSPSNSNLNSHTSSCNGNGSGSESGNCSGILPDAQLQRTIDSPQRSPLMDSSISFFTPDMCVQNVEIEEVVDPQLLLKLNSGDLLTSSFTGMGEIHNSIGSDFGNFDPELFTQEPLFLSNFDDPYLYPIAINSNSFNDDS